VETSKNAQMQAESRIRELEAMFEEKAHQVWIDCIDYITAAWFSGTRSMRYAKMSLYLPSQVTSLQSELSKVQQAHSESGHELGEVRNDQNSGKYGLHTKFAYRSLYLK
jgi:hypothetical protein